MSKHDGGPAFPGNDFSDPDWYKKPMIPQFQGMSLRDYFAAAALQGITNLPSVGPGKWHQWADEWAAWSYSVADAMLVERAKNRKQP